MSVTDHSVITYFLYKLFFARSKNNHRMKYHRIDKLWSVSVTKGQFRNINDMYCIVQNISLNGIVLKTA